MKEDVGAQPRIRALLESADPLRSEPALRASDVERMRHAVLNAEKPPATVMTWWPRALAAAALVVLLVIAGTIGSRDPARPEQPGDAIKAVAPADPAERRQLQFETPGGTRIIWTIDPDFKLEGAAP
jgi:hypothetical protein